MNLRIKGPYVDSFRTSTKIKFYRCLNHCEESTKKIEKAGELLKECRNDNKLTHENIGEVLGSFISVLEEISQNRGDLKKSKTEENNTSIRESPKFEPI